MSRPPIVKPKELARALKKMGFDSRPGKGSHMIFYDASRQALVPMHPKPLGKGLPGKIIKQLDISRAELKKNL